MGKKNQEQLTTSLCSASGFKEIILRTCEENKTKTKKSLGTDNLEDNSMFNYLGDNSISFVLQLLLNDKFNIQERELFIGFYFYSIDQIFGLGCYDQLLNRIEETETKEKGFRICFFWCYYDRGCFKKKSRLKCSSIH